MLKELRAAVKRDPNNLELNKKFIYAWGWGDRDSTIILQYNLWLRRFPRSYVMPLAIGEVLFQSNGSPKAAKFLKRAVALNPKLSEAWFLLSEDAGIRGDTIGKCEYLEKAIKLDPTNPQYAFYDAMQFRQSDPVLFRRLLLDILKKYPKSQWGTIGISFLIDDEKDEGRKVTYYELAKNKYLKNRGHWYYELMIDYFKHMLIVDPHKSLEIAQLQNIGPNIELAKTIIKAKDLLVRQKAEDANKLIQSVTLGGATPENLLLFKAQIADAANRTKLAFDSVSFYYSKRPTDTLQKTLFFLGRKLRFSNNDIITKITKLRDSTAKEAVDFTLYNYLTNKKVSLADYRGKVILLTNWQPSMYGNWGGGEFFERIFKKFNKNNVAYIGINFNPQQDDYVLPFLKYTGYSFVPLRDSTENRKGNIEPGYNGITFNNYLIDQLGCIIFSGFTLNGHNDRMLELMIGELLKTNDALLIVSPTDAKIVK